MTKIRKNHLILVAAASFLSLIFTANSFAVQHHQMSAEAQALLKNVMAEADRPERQTKRDKYRHPVETLKFIGIEPDMTVAEIWPGGQGGWYRAILEPFFEAKGTYIPVRSRSDFPGTLEDFPYGKVDMVMVFRAHGFMIYRNPAQEYVNAIFSMLKPGGILTIVDHAGDENIPQDPKGENGYVNESHFRAMAAKAGFVFLTESDVNRNPKDDKNHPRGVFSLPPSLQGSLPLTGERKKILEIGESDRFTLKFYKPE